MSRFVLFQYHTPTPYTRKWESETRAPKRFRYKICFFFIFLLLSQKHKHTYAYAHNTAPNWI